MELQAGAPACVKRTREAAYVYRPPLFPPRPADDCGLRSVSSLAAVRRGRLSEASYAAQSANALAGRTKIPPRVFWILFFPQEKYRREDSKRLRLFRPTHGRGCQHPLIANFPTRKFLFEGTATFYKKSHQKLLGDTVYRMIIKRNHEFKVGTALKGCPLLYLFRLPLVYLDFLYLCPCE